MKALVQLRCPKRCLLGVVAMHDGSPKLAVHRRQLVTRSLEGPPAQQQVDAGPFELDELDTVDIGCRHLTGLVLGSTEFAPGIRDSVDRVRAGTTRAPAVVVLTVNGARV